MANITEDPLIVTVYLSKQGKELLTKRIEKVLAELDAIRAEKEIAYTASGDTWHDNPGFNALEQAEHRKALEVRELQIIYSTGEVKSVDPRPTDVVGIGSIVQYSQLVENTGQEESGSYEIVGFGESDPTCRKIAYDSPIGSVLFGLKVGESVEAGIFIPAKKSICYFEVTGLFPSWQEALVEGRND
jgi:transcription elongation GreA/GreB family factor